MASHDVQFYFKSSSYYRYLLWHTIMYTHYSVSKSCTTNKLENIVLQLTLLLRVAFTKLLLEMASLSGKLDASDLLVLHEEAGTITAEREGTVCAMVQVKLTASSGKS